jgi:hypothetical protein
MTSDRVAGEPVSWSGLSEGARDLQRAAGAMQKHAAAVRGTSPPAAVLAHVEEALDRLEVTIQMLSSAAAADDRSEGAALRFHLAETARRLRSASVACAASRGWTRPSRTAVARRVPVGAIALGDVHADDGPHGVVAAVDELDLTYRVLATTPHGETRELARRVATLREARGVAHAHLREVANG